MTHKSHIFLGKILYILFFLNVEIGASEVQKHTEKTIWTEVTAVRPEQVPPDNCPPGLFAPLVKSY